MKRLTSSPRQVSSSPAANRTSKFPYQGKKPVELYRWDFDCLLYQPALTATLAMLRDRELCRNSPLGQSLFSSTKRTVGRVAASAITSASWSSFF
jgi:hypothetical protein